MKTIDIQINEFHHPIFKMCACKSEQLMMVAELNRNEKIN